MYSFMLYVVISFLVTWSNYGIVTGQWVVNPENLTESLNPNHKCVMWGECHSVGAHRRNCYYDGPALQMFHEFLSEEERLEVRSILERRCPQFLYDENGIELPESEIFTCCSYDQLIGVAESSLMADGAIGRCPACLRNFITQICEMNCSPEQARFVDVRTETVVLEDGSDLEYIDEVNYRMHEDFMLESHSACSGVIIPQTGVPAINLMCGNAPVCDAEAWYRFSGDYENNPFAPVQVNFLRWTDEYESMNAQALSCNDTFNNDLPCSCVDCWKNCPTGVEPLVPDMCSVLSVNCIGFSVGITFFVITVTVFSILTVIDYKKTREGITSDNTKHQDISKLIKVFEAVFSKIGSFCADNPILIIMTISWLCVGMLYGALNINLTVNPIELWSSPDSRTRKELDYFNSRFEPFYRTSQVYLQVTGLENFTRNDVEYGPAFRIEAIREAIALEDAIFNIGRETGDVTLEQVCTAPMRQHGEEERLDQCVVMSISTYFGDDKHNIDNSTYLTRIQNCINNHLGLTCMATWGGGAEPAMVFGGYSNGDVLKSDTLVINIPLKNHIIQENLLPVLEWEKRFIDLMHDYEANGKPSFVSLSFGAERSVEDEIQRVSEAEIIPLGISYFLMLIYVVLSLGHIKSCRTFLVDSKMTVGFTSIIVVILAILCALGLMGYLGITTTLLAINVIPFFVLSVGIDNVFLMVNTLEEVNNNLKKYEDYATNMSFTKQRKFVFEKMMAKAGPSIFITSVTQITCFSIGSISNFPAVITFAIFATFTLAFLFIFQITIIIAILSIDYKRATQNRLDILCCVQKKILDDTNPLTSGEPYIGVIQRLMVPYSNFLLNWRVKIIVAVIFMAMVSISIILVPQLEIGLDQELALPKDSYVYKYLLSVSNLLQVGPPVYFILTPGLNFTNPDHQNTICGGQLCNTDSLTTQVFLASLHSDVTFISQSSNSWIDDFFDWSTLYGACCRYNTNDGTFCTSSNTSNVCEFCTADLDDNQLRPIESSFHKYFPFFLQDPPTEQCNKGGLASYKEAVNYLLDSAGHATIQESYFMAFHNPLSTSWDYIQAVKYAQEISANITKAIHDKTGMTDVEVFPYSVFYVFFEQYLTMWRDTFKSLSYSVIAALFFTLLLSGFNFVTTFSVVFTAILIVINMMGMMYIWNIPLNAVSCVNLIISIGIGVEFCSHTAYAFSTSRELPRDKVKDALRKVGSTIVTGITLTNIPIIVLAFSYTELIEIFFFRMFFGLVIIGFLHGMIFLPVLLSFISNITS